MNQFDYLQVAVYLFLLVALTPLTGRWIFTVLKGERHVLARVFGFAERGIYRLLAIDPTESMDWRAYLGALLAFHAVGFAFIFALLLAQGHLPFNPAGLPGVEWALAFNTAVSFLTNTNWQSYAGETTLSPFVQMTALGTQNFLSAACGLAVFVALARGIAGKSALGLGNFWADITRGVLYILLPLSFVLALVFVSEGVVESFNTSPTVTTLEGAAQTIPLGPVASQEAIKLIGTNGGGYFNANSAHPFENPTPLTNFLQMLAILLIPAGLTHTFGLWVGARRHGWVLFSVMFAMLTLGLICSLAAEYGAGGLLEGKEQRFGVAGSVLYSVVTTAASAGAVNSMHSSLAPLAGGIAMLNMMLGEVIFGGVGAGLYGLLLFVLLTVFLAGLMVGRTPEYLGKKIAAREMTMVILALLIPSAAILLGTALSLAIDSGGLSSAGPHGFSELLYAWTSASANNGSAFAGLNANTRFYNLALGLAMVIGRFGVIVPVLVVAGSLGEKKIAPPSIGTFAVDTPLFGALLFAIILIVGGLTFLPALSLGPITEHLLMLRGEGF